MRHQKLMRMFVSTNREVRTASWASYITFQLFNLALAILLFKAAKKRSSRLCKLWMILAVITNLCLFATVYINNQFFYISITVHIFCGIFLLYKVYCLYVVWSFVKEIRSYGGFNAALSGLTDAEVAEFEQGCPPDYEKDHGSGVQNQAFNKDFEILANQLEIDESSLLGEGAFGRVLRGKLKVDNSTVKPVAVKTVSSNADITYFKTLLSELKVMAFLSTTQHDNIVNLVGACTADIKRKQLFVVVEFCPYGNLHDYLKARRGLFVSLVKEGEIRTDLKPGIRMYTNLNAGNTVTTFDIFKWMYEASRGLEFLEERKIIHGDIAARNILLSCEKVAKISDFGLAKKLYQYTTIVKEETLLPWRWMALESLRDMQFSTKSDVWSFSTTLWEAFSLCELPFPGFTWDKDFIRNLQEGLRMKQPKNATKQIYDLMLRCWQPDPEDRPSFEEVRKQLEQMLLKLKLSFEDWGLTTAQELQCNQDEVELYLPKLMYSNPEAVVV